VDVSHSRVRAGHRPRVEYNHVFFGSDDNHLYAVNVQTGRAAWKSETLGPVRSRPAVGDETIYFGCEDGSIYAVIFAPPSGGGLRLGEL